MVLQLVYTDDGTRHALMALSGIHRGFEAAGQAGAVCEDFAQEQYRLAIRTHLQDFAAVGHPRSADEVVKHLASCIVFACIEMLQGHYASATSLIQGAVQLFYHSEPGLSMSSPELLHLFESLLARLQAQVVGLLGETAAGKALVPPYLHPTSKISMPEKFDSMTEARTHLDFFLYSRTLATAEGGTSGAQKDAQQHQRKLCLRYANTMTRWSLAFDALLDSIDESMLTQQETQALSILKIRRLMGLAIIKMAFEGSYLPEDETLWDLYIPVWEEVVSIAETIHNGSLDNRIEQTHQFTLDSTLIAPLYEVARLCREPALRRRAIALLRTHPTREGLWDSLLAAQAAERQMETEERAVGGPVTSAADIPKESRVVTMLPAFKEGERKAVLTMVKHLPVDNAYVEAQTRESIVW